MSHVLWWNRPLRSSQTLTWPFTLTLSLVKWCHVSLCYLKIILMNKFSREAELERSTMNRNNTKELYVYPGQLQPPLICYVLRIINYVFDVLHNGASHATTTTATISTNNSILLMPLAPPQHGLDAVLCCCLSLLFRLIWPVKIIRHQTPGRKVC